MREEFVIFPQGRERSHFMIQLAGTSYCDESYEIYRENAVCMVAEYIIKGQGTVILDGKEYVAKEGDIYLLPLGCEHFYYSDKNNPWEKIWFNAGGTLSQTLLKEYNPGNLVVFENAGGRELFEKMHEVGKNEEYSADQKHKIAALIFHEILQYLYDRFYGEEMQWAKETLRMKEYLEQHMTKNVSLKELGDLVYLSESQVIRKFKKDMGMTPHAYILELKIEQAKKLLKNTCLMVREIAEYLGFCDEHYFSYVFKKRTGKTPLEYKEKNEL